MVEVDLPIVISSFSVSFSCLFCNSLSKLVVSFAASVLPSTLVMLSYIFVIDSFCLSLARDHRLLLTPGGGLLYDTCASQSDGLDGRYLSSAFFSASFNAAPFACNVSDKDGLKNLSVALLIALFGKALLFLYNCKSLLSVKVSSV